MATEKEMMASVSAERVYRSIKQAIKNIRVLFSLEEFEKDDWEKLRKLMDGREFQRLLNACKKYMRHYNLPADALIDANSNTDDPLKPIVGDDLEMSTVIKIMEKNRAASDFCLTIKLSSLGGCAFLKGMEELCEYTRQRTSTTPEEEERREQLLQGLFAENEVMRQKVAGLKQKLANIETKQKNMLTAKEDIISRHHSHIDTSRKKCLYFAERKVAESEMQMMVDWKQSEMRQLTLQEEVRAQQQALENSMKERLAREKDLRVKRYKVESQLVAVLDKYDADIGDRHAKLEQLTAKLDEERLELEQLQERFEEQETLYKELMTEKENYERRLFQEKLSNIQQKIAARKIQRCFRKYLDKSKAKGRRRGKGKKERKKK